MTQKNHSLKGWKGLLLFILPYLLIVGTFQLAGFYVAGVDILDMSGNESTSQKTISSFFGLIGTFLVIWIFTRGIYKESFMSLGFSVTGRGKDLIIGLLTGLTVMSVIFFFLLTIHQINISTIVFDPVKLIWLFLLFIIIAVVEEVLCRGFILGNLMVTFHKYSALIISALIFVALHAFNPSVSGMGLTNLFLAGIALGLPYIYTHNLILPIGLHFSWNFFQSIFGFHVSGFETYSIFQISIVKNNLMNGGKFGFEGSILCSLILLIIIFGFSYYYERKVIK